MICIEVPVTFAERCELDARRIRERRMGYVPATAESTRPLSCEELLRLGKRRWSALFEEWSPTWCGLPQMAHRPGPVLRAEGWKSS